MFRHFPPYQGGGEVGLALCVCPQLPAGYVPSGRSRGGVGSAWKRPI